jgi:hypothetical protein
MGQLGFSTGAIALSDFRRALNILQTTDTNAIELSALRFPELRPLLDELPHLDLGKYSYVSIHAPSGFSRVEERAIVDQIAGITFGHVPVIVHPDSIHDFGLWNNLGMTVCIENMDSRKRSGRTAAELASFFERLPEARFCLDVAHARQFDTSMVESFLMLERFADRLVQVHLSEINMASRHVPMSEAAIAAYQMIGSLIPRNVAMILESRLSDNVSTEEINREIAKGRRAFPWLTAQTVAA